MLSLIPRLAPWPLPRASSEVSDLWVQYRFLGTEAIDEVTDAVATLYGTATLADGKLVTNPAGPANYAAMNNIIFDANEDFNISLNVNMPFSNSRPYNTILGVYTSTAGPRAWALGRIGNDTNPSKLHFTMVSGGVKYDFYGPVLNANTDYHIEVSRTQNVLYIFVNGNLELATPFALGNDQASLPRMRTDVILAEGQTATLTHHGGGYKWGLQIFKGKGGHTSNFTPEAPVEYSRPYYTADVAQDIKLQLGMRRGTKACEASGAQLALNGTAAVGKNARLSLTNVTTSYASIPVAAFGEADFTIEFMCNLSAVHSTYGNHFGHMFSSVSASEDNRWIVWVSPSGRLGFSMSLSANANDTVGTGSVEGAFKFNRDNHIVVQRKDGVIKLYLNKQEVAQMTQAAPIRGGAGVFRTQSLNGATSCAGQLWNIRIADRALYSEQVKTKPTFPQFTKEYDPTLFMQYTFSYDEAINEVTETFAALSGNAAVSNGRLSTGSSASDNMSTPATLIEPNEDFTLEAMFNCTTHNVNMPILGIVGGSNTGVSKNAWYLHYDVPAAAFRFMVYDGTGASDMVQFARPNIFNTDTHIAIARKGGVMTLFIAGQPVASTPSIKGNVPTSVQMGTTFSSTYMNGTRTNFRLVRGRALYDSAFEPPVTLPVVGRPTYTQQEAAATKAQIDLRRDSARNDANGRSVQVYSSARHVRGRILHAAATSSFYYAPCEPFGAGDFTIGLDFNLTSINGTYGGALAGQWVRGNVASEDNCWLIYVGPTRLIQFAWARSAAANDFDFIASAAGVFDFSADYRLVVERIGTTLTIYLNNVQVAQGTCAIPLRTNAPHYVRSNSSANLYAFGGSVWNLRISDRAVYNGNVTRVPLFPKMPKAAEYTDQSLLNDIVVQCDMNEGNARNAKTGEVITFSGTGAAIRERLVTTLANTSRWYIPCGPFSAGDFTIEFDLNLLSSTGASSRPIFGQFRGDVGPNSWVFYTTSSGNLAFQCLGVDASSLSIDSLNGPIEKRTLTAGKEHHVVVERKAGVVTMYIDGVVIGSGAFTAQLVDMSAYPYITNLYDLSTAKYCASEIGNVRIAKRALYNGVITKARLPLVPNQKPSLTANIGSAIGTLSGACQNLYYGGVQSSLGAFSHTLFRDIRDPQNVKTVRLVALALDRTYTVLAWREVDMPPTADMPQFTNSLKIGNAAPLLISNSSGASVANGVTGRYWSGNPFGPLTHGTAIPFEFV